MVVEFELVNTELKFNYDKNLDVKNNKLFKKKIKSNHNIDSATQANNTCNITKTTKK